MSSVSTIQVQPQLLLPAGKGAKNVTHYCDVVRREVIPTDMVEIGGQVKDAAKKQGFFKKTVEAVQKSKVFGFVKKHKVACAIGAAAVATGAIIAGVVAHKKKKADNN